MSGAPVWGYDECLPLRPVDRSVWVGCVIEGEEPAGGPDRCCAAADRIGWKRRHRLCRGQWCQAECKPGGIRRRCLRRETKRWRSVVRGQTRLPRKSGCRSSEWRRSRSHERVSRNCCKGGAAVWVVRIMAGSPRQGCGASGDPTLHLDGRVFPLSRDNRECYCWEMTESAV